jgi:hypothetical protein
LLSGGNYLWQPTFAHIGQRGQVLPYAVGDGGSHVFHVCPQGSGMSSLLVPDVNALAFFNLFADFGRVESTCSISTRRLDDISELPQLDFLKIDAQGSELMIFVHGRNKLRDCVAIQTEISFITLYRQQPTFADIDRELPLPRTNPSSLYRCKMLVYFSDYSQQ